MSPRPRGSVLRDRVDPVGPWGRFVDGVLGSHKPRWTYDEAANLVTQQARTAGERYIRFDRYNIRNWLLGSTPRRHSWYWIADGWSVSIDDVIAAIDEHKSWAAQQKIATRERGPQRGGHHLADADAEAPASPPAVMSVIASHAHGQSQPLTSIEDPYLMLRRQFLAQLLSVSASALAPSFVTIGSQTPRIDDVEHVIQQCDTNIRACWRLMQGPDMVVVPSVLAAWLPVLDSLLRTSSARRRDLAALAAEGYMLGGLVTVLQGHYDRSEMLCRQAVQYAEMAGSPNLTVAALKHLATKYHDASYPLLTLTTYKRALPHIQDASPLLRSRTHLGLALAHAQVGNRTDAERHLGLAHEQFPDQPERDPAYVYADARRASLNHYSGLMHMIHDRPDRAWQTLAEAVAQPAASDVPERTVIEIINAQAGAAIGQGDVGLAVEHVEISIHRARRLGSLRRIQDSAALFQQLMDRWPDDARVRRLRELFASTDAAPVLEPDND
jgi:hypothetical protein